MFGAEGMIENLKVNAEGVNDLIPQTSNLFAGISAGVFFALLSVLFLASQATASPIHLLKFDFRHVLTLTNL